MSTITKLPNLAASFQKLKIGIDLQRAAIGNSVIELAIQRAFHEKKCINQIIAWVKSQATDNPRLMAGIIGAELVERILNFNEA